MTRTRVALILSATLASLVVAGCGGSSSKHENNDLGAGDLAVNPTPTPSPEPLPSLGRPLPCKSSGQNAFQTYGVKAFLAVNTNIITLATSGTVVAQLPQFGSTTHPYLGDATLPATQDNAATFSGRLAAFLVYAYGGPTSITYTDGKSYSGVQDMALAHQGLNITSSQYDYFISNVVVPALTQAGVPSEDISSCFAPVVVDPVLKAAITYNGVGAGSTTACASVSGSPSPFPNAFNTYGSAFVEVNHQIVLNALNQISASPTPSPAPDQVLGQFANIGDGTLAATTDGPTAFEGKLAAFLVYFYGGPTSIHYPTSTDPLYDGRIDMTTAHTGLNITSDQYDYFLSAVVIPALQKFSVPSADINSCFGAPLEAADFKNQVVGK